MAIYDKKIENEIIREEIGVALIAEKIKISCLKCGLDMCREEPYKHQ